MSERAGHGYVDFSEMQFILRTINAHNFVKLAQMKKDIYVVRNNQLYTNKTDFHIYKAMEIAQYLKEDHLHWTITINTFSNKHAAPQ